MSTLQSWKKGGGAVTDNVLCWGGRRTGYLPLFYFPFLEEQVTGSIFITQIRKAARVDYSYKVKPSGKCGATGGTGGRDC